METLTLSSVEIKDIADRFEALASKVPLRVITNDAEYDEAVRMLNALLDSPMYTEGGPLGPLVTMLGDLIADYDEKHFTLPDASPSEVLRELMNQRQLKQSDIPEIGSQGVVSEILNGKRELNTRQIATASHLFRVSPAAFFPRVEKSAKRMMKAARI
jgi:HTH-type transcriptional regulator/antitoxin HigA